MAENKAPERMCVVCRTASERTGLIRIMRDAQGNFFLEPAPKTFGRSAYICKKRECVDKCFKKKLLNKTFKQSIPEDVYARLYAENENI